MLATLADAPFDRAGWLFEVKWDGYRVIGEVRGGQPRLYSRTGLDFAKRFPPVVHGLRTLGHDAVLDGEVVALDAQGRPRFQLLQNYQRTGRGTLAYYVFDLLYLDGHDLRGLPLARRKALLAAILGDTAVVRVSEHVEGDGVALFRAATEQGLEGVIAKDASSPYREGARSGEWLKIKAQLRQEAVIGGFTAPRGSRTALGALVLGVYEGEDLVYIGHTGGGFDADSLETVRSRLDPLVQADCPFRECPRTNAPARWVRPNLVCEVRFSEWTDDGRMRQPIFLGLREDKPAREVRRETPQPAADLVKNSKAVWLPRRKSRHPSPPRAAQKPDAVNGRAKAPLTNLNKVYWPTEGYTKGDLVAYYREVAPVLLPYLVDRPQSLHRYPDGIAGKSFFQKDAGDRLPAGIATASVSSQSNGGLTRYLLCQDEGTLLYLVNLGCIEINPWNSRVGSLDRPDYVVIDLDPQGVPFRRVVEAAKVVRRALDAAGANCVCKTSGKRGLHVFVPLAARYDYDQALQLARIIAELAREELPATTSVVRSPRLRQGKVYLDFLQNRWGQTVAAPYSVRPVPGAAVSTPLKWSEVRAGLDPAQFTMRTTRRRLDRLGDLWAPVLGSGIDLEECLERLRRGHKRAARRESMRQ
jgi:bifunctional non-homologous end joining protein LigD